MVRYMPLMDYTIDFCVRILGCFLEMWIRVNKFGAFVYGGLSVGVRLC